MKKLKLDWAKITFGFAGNGNVASGTDQAAYNKALDEGVKWLTRADKEWEEKMEAIKKGK